MAVLESAKDDYKSVFKRPDTMMVIICITEILMLAFYLIQQNSYNALADRMWKNACFHDMFYPEDTQGTTEGLGIDGFRVGTAPNG